MIKSGAEDIALYPKIVSWENLWRAYQKAARGKRGKRAAARFELRLADEILQLQDELRQQTYRPGAYKHFYIHEPKRRKISASPFRDRVVHHALCNLIEPIFEQRFYLYSYANRVGLGNHRAVDRLQHCCQRYRYVLRLDIVQHFPSIDHHILADILFKHVSDAATRRLIHLILSGGEGVLRDEYDMVYFPGDDLLAVNRPRGLPIGNLTSQFWSNCYLNDFDWFVKRELGCSAYLRYVDDFALFSDSKRQLQKWKTAICARLTDLRLTIHEREAQLAPVTEGVPWLGFVVYPTHRRLKRRNAVAFARRLRRNLALYEEGTISFGELDASVQGWIAHVVHGDTWGLRTHLLGQHTLPTTE